MEEYNKIETVFERDIKTKKLNENKWRNPTVQFLKDLDWEFTEKIDGTNIRIFWDGHRVSYYGRTDNAQIPSQLMNKLIDLFGGEENEEMFEQKFGETNVMLCGEGFGAKIQKGGGNYLPNEVDFALFDVMINGNYLSRESVKDIAEYFNLRLIPTIFIGNLQKGIDFVKGKPKSTIGIADMEGLVERPLLELKDKQGKRVIVKIKVYDFGEIKNEKRNS